MPKRSTSLSAARIRELAVSGAASLLSDLRAEVSAIERTFPELASPQGRRQTVQGVRKQTRKMSAAARKAVSARMRKYWAERRKARTAK